MVNNGVWHAVRELSKLLASCLPRLHFSRVSPAGNGAGLPRRNDRSLVRVSEEKKRRNEADLPNAHAATSRFVIRQAQIAPPYTVTIFHRGGYLFPAAGGEEGRWFREEAEEEEEGAALINDRRLEYVV